MKRRPQEKSASVLEWETHFRYCFLCGADKWHTNRGAGLVTHHVQRRNTCFKPYQDNWENLMRLCWVECHDTVEHWPKPRQLALKWQHDKAGHSTLAEFLTSWLHIGDKGSGSAELVAPHRVTVEEVQEYLEAA